MRSVPLYKHDILRNNTVKLSNRRSVDDGNFVDNSCLISFCPSFTQFFLLASIAASCYSSTAAALHQCLLWIWPVVCCSSSLFPFIALCPFVHTAWFSRTGGLFACFLFLEMQWAFEDTTTTSVCIAFFWHLFAYIYVSTTPSSMTHYPRIPFSFNLLCSPSQYFFPSLSLWTSTPIYCSHLLYCLHPLAF